MRFFTFLFLTVFLYGCGGASENLNTTANSKPANSNAATVNANNPLATTKTPEAATTNSAPTLAPVLAGYYAALNKKDEAGTKKFLSQAALKYWEDEAKTEKKTAFAYLLESEEPLNEKREIRNEKIEGDKAFAEKAAVSAFGRRRCLSKKAASGNSLRRKTVLRKLRICRKLQPIPTRRDNSLRRKKKKRIDYLK